MHKKNKVAVLTGAGRLNGIGAATAKSLAMLGYNIVLNCLNSIEEIQQVASICRSYNVQSLVHVGDLTQVEVCQELAQITQDNFGEANVVVNCIGYSKRIPFNQLDLLDSSVFMRIQEVNVLAPFLVAQAFHL